MTTPNDSTLIAAAEAVKDALNEAPEGTFDQDFTAVRSYRPRYTPKELETLRVTVVPRGVERSILGRRTRRIDPIIDIGIQKKLTSPTDESDAAFDNVQGDALMALVEAIADYLDSKRLPGYLDAAPVVIENDPAWSQERLAGNIFMSVITFTLRRAKAM